MGINERLSKLKKWMKNIPDNLRDAILAYQESYKVGVDKFGVWWKVFQISMWSFVLIFIVTAVIILVFYLPKAELLLRG